MERMNEVCFQISERFGLLHVSRGQDPDRFIEIRKPVQNVCREGEQDQAVSPVVSEEQDLDSGKLRLVKCL